MKIITGATGATHVTSNNDGEFNQGILGDGLIVFTNGHALDAQISNNNLITVLDGDLVFQGRHALIEPETNEELTISTGAIDKNRNDLIVARYAIDTETGYESLTLEVIEGTETSGSPADPAITEGVIRTGATLAEVPLYRVRIEGINIVGLDKLFTPIEPIIAQIASLAAQMLSGSDIVDNLTSTSSTKVLSAKQGKTLKDLVDGKQDALTNPLTKSDVVNNLTTTTTNVPLSANQGKVLKGQIDSKVNTTDTIAVAHGGTGATTASGARTNLGLGDASTKSSTTSVTSGSSALVTSGAVYTAINNLSGVYMTGKATKIFSKQSITTGTKYTLSSAITNYKFILCVISGGTTPEVTSQYIPVQLCVDKYNATASNANSVQFVLGLSYNMSTWLTFHDATHFTPVSVTSGYSYITLYGIA